MIKYILFSLFVLGALPGTAQLITNRQMYNFNVGDTIQWSSPYSNCGIPGKYEERVFVGKQEHAGYVLYTVKDTRLYRCNGQQCHLPDKTVIHDIRINDLDTAVLFSETPVFPTYSYYMKKDTIYTDESLGGKIVFGSVYYRHPYAYYYDAMWGKTLFIEGVGELYDLKVVPNVDPCTVKRKLEFYHKVGELPYGKRVIEPPAPPPIKEQLEIYPTFIADHVLHIDYKGEEDMQVQFSSTDGRIIGQELVKPGANIFNLNVNPGLYIVKFSSSNSLNGKFRRIIIHDH